jgi:hypothetical protein
MRCRFLLAMVLLIGPGTASVAVESGVVALTIIRAEVKTHDRVVYWLVNTPIYHEDPYFEVAVRSSGIVIVGEHEPESAHELMPEYWKPGTLVQGRVDRHHLFLKRLNGSEVRFIITRRTKAPPE